MPGVAAAIGLALAISRSWVRIDLGLRPAVATIMRHGHLHGAKAAVVGHVRHFDLDGVNAARTTAGTFRANHGHVRLSDLPIGGSVSGARGISGAVTLAGGDAP